MSSFVQAADTFWINPETELQLGQVTNLEKIHGNGGKVFVESIDSINATIKIGIQRKENATPNPDTGKYIEDDYYAAVFQSSGDVRVANFGVWGKGQINGSLTAESNFSSEEHKQKVDEIKNSIKQNIGYGLSSGEIRIGSSEANPFTVKNDVTTFMLKIGAAYDGGVTDLSPSNYFGFTVIDGDVNASFLFNDNYLGFDSLADYLKIGGTAHVYEDMVNNGAVAINRLIVDGTFWNGHGDYLNDDGSLADKDGQPGEHIFAQINELDAKTIINASNLFVGTLTNTRDQVYNQLFGTIQVENNWFTNSTINLSGGIIDEVYLGQAHNLGINNTYNVTGGVLKVGDLRGDSTIHLSDKGKLETKLDSVFENYSGVANAEGLNIVSLSSAVPESIRNTVTDIFRVYVPGTVIDNVMERVTLNGGQIVISGVDLTETQRDDLMAAFKETFFHNFQESFSQLLTPWLVA